MSLSLQSIKAPVARVHASWSVRSGGVGCALTRRSSGANARTAGAPPSAPIAARGAPVRTASVAGLSLPLPTHSLDPKTGVHVHLPQGTVRQRARAPANTKTRDYRTFESAHRAQTTCAPAHQQARKQTPQSVAQWLLPFSRTVPPRSSHPALLNRARDWSSLYGKKLTNDIPLSPPAHSFFIGPTVINIHIATPRRINIHTPLTSVRWPDSNAQAAAGGVP